MPLEIRLQQKQVQKLMMTQQLQQAIRLLLLSRAELVETVQQELLENPYLEERENPPALEERSPEAEERKAPEQDEVYDRESSREADWEDYLGDFASSPRDSHQREVQEEESAPPETRYAEKPTLEGHLRWQLHLSDMTEREMLVGECIIGNLDSSGYLRATVAEIAQLSGADEETVLSVLSRVQRFDPVGVAARDAKECLLVQMEDRGLDDPVLVAMVRDHLEDFEARRFKPMMRRFHLDEEDVREYMLLLQTLDPMPGASFGGGEPAYVSPDVYVRKIGGEFVVLLNDDGLPQLTLSDTCEQGMLRGTAKDRSYCAEKRRGAQWLIRSLEQRNRTLCRVTESIVRHQRDFFENGPSGLKPLILREIAEDIGMHESTVSRITTNKYVATPHGVFELKYFFNSGLSLADGTQVGSESVKVQIRKMIAEEDATSPLSDDAIAKTLNDELGVNISRRTVAKYRGMLDIPSSSRRRRVI